MSVPRLLRTLRARLVMLVGSAICCGLLSPQPARADCPDCTGIWPPAPGEIFLHSTGFANAPDLPAISVTESLTFADVDGDGLADACAHDGTSVRCYLHAESDGTYSCGRIGSAVQISTGFGPTWANSPDHWQTLQYPDVDGDGIADLCGRGNDGIYCATGASGFSDTSLWLSDFDNAGGWDSDPAYWQTIRFPDVDGDGSDDICGRGIEGIYCALSGGESFVGMGPWSASFGDGDDWNGHPSLWSTIQFADINDDGADDICGRGYAGVYCARSRPLLFDFEPPTLWTSQFSDQSWTLPQYYETLQLADINGDGNADICGRGIAGLYCGISVGNEFLAAEQLNIDTFSDASNWDQPSYYETIRLTDVNGDQRADACGRGAEGIYCALAKPYLAGVSSGWADLFEPTTLQASDFGDDKGWAAHEEYWGTVQPALAFGGEPGTVFCGRSAAGIRCQNPWRMRVIPDYLTDCDPIPEDPPAIGELATAVVLYRHPDDTAVPPSVAEIQNRVSLNADSLDAYLQEVSFGVLSVVGMGSDTADVFSDGGAPFVLPEANVQDIDNEALDPLAGIANSDYDLILYWRAGSFDGNYYGAEGRAYISAGANQASMGLLAHETIHALGIDHANAYDCLDEGGSLTTLSDNCFPIGYGNGYSMMGSGTQGAHPGTYAKARLGWYYSDQIETIAPDVALPFEQTYTLSSITEASNGLMALRIPLATDLVLSPSGPPPAGARRYLYLEHRTATDWEPATVANNGVVLTIATDLYANHQSLLLNTNPQVPGRVESPVAQGQTFQSAELGVEVEVLSITAAGAEVRVRLVSDGDCGNGVVDGFEECDSGVPGGADCCSGDCTLEPAQVVCRAAIGQCDLPEYCSGSDPSCGTDEAAPDGTPCSDQKICTDGDTCIAGSCQPGGCATGRDCAVCGSAGSCGIVNGQCGCR